jgi:hypothetical protein
MPSTSRMGRARSLLTESMWITINQVCFSVASVVATAFVAREASVHDAATVFAVYALESVVVTSSRGFVVTAPLLRHAGSRLCNGDMIEAFRWLALVALLSLLPYAVLGFWLSHSWPTAVAAAAWSAGMFLADIVRQVTVSFGRHRASTAAVGTYLIAVLALGHVVGERSFRLFLVGVAILSLVLVAALWTMVARRGEKKSCGFWRTERAFAGSQAAEGAGAVSMVSLTFLALARLAPTQLVGLQVASQALIGPALVVANGFAIPFTRRAALKHQRGESEVAVLLCWGAVLVLGMAVVSGISIVGTDIFTRIFGSSWAAAQLLVPALAAQAVVFVGAQIALTRYRSRLRPAILRRFWLTLIGLGYGTILLGVVVNGPGALREAIWLSDALTAVFAVGAVARFEHKVAAARSLRGVRRDSDESLSP